MLAPVSNRFCIVLALVTAATLTSDPLSDAHAQNADGLVLEEIIVTAQKRQETLQDVPISVAVIGANELNDAGLDKIEDIQAYVPNLQMTESGISTQMYVRGIGTGNNQGFEQSVGQYVDGVYYGRQQLIRAPFFDLERVEVLRGPQGVLFGKNTIAGALNMTTARPTDEFSGLVSVEGGDFGILDGQLAVSGPFSDTVRGRLAVRYYEEDGYFKNVFRGRDETQREDVGIRGTLEWDATDDLILSLKIESNQFDAVGRSISILQDDVSIAPFPTAGLNFDQIFTNVLGQPDRVGDPVIDYNRRADAAEFSNNDLTNITFTADYGWGENDLTLVTGFVEYDILETCDCDFIAGSIFGTLANEEYEQFSQEIRLASPTGDNVEWIVGAFYQTGDLDYQDNIIIPPDTVLQFLAGGALAPVTDTSVHRDYFADSDLWAAFGQFTWNVSDTFRLSLGGRYTQEDKSASRELNVWDNATQTVSVNPVAPLVFAGAFAIQTEQTTGHSLVGSVDESIFTPSGSFQWDLSPETMIYGSISTGFKAGGFDARANNIGSWEFQEEEALAYELGLKSSFWDGRAEINVAAYFTDYDDLQIAQFDGVLGFNVGNAAKTEVSGLEIDGRVLLTDGLTLRYGFGFLDHEFKDFQNGNCYNRQTPDGVIGPQGNQLCDYTGFAGQYTPEFTSSLVFDYERPIGQGDTVFTFLLAHNYTSEQNVHVNLDPLYEIDGYSLVDARVGIRTDRWSVALLGKNLLDEDIVTYAGNTPLSGSTFGTNTFYGFVSAPQTITLQGTLEF